MRKIIPANFLLILSVLILFLFSCTPQSCFEETESFLKATLYLYKTRKILAPDSLTVYGLNMGTNKLYNKTINIKTALLPLNASSHECTYIVEINGKTDTIEFRYTTYPHLISKECGFTFYHNLYIDSLVYTRHEIDSIYIRKNVITTVNEENIQIFY